MPIIPEWKVIRHTAEDTVSNCFGYLAPRIFGIKTAKVLPTECDDENTLMKEKARYEQTVKVLNNRQAFMSNIDHVNLG